MAMYVQKADLTYVSVPKCACSSLKRFCYEVDNGHPFPEPEQSEPDWKSRTVHKRFPSHRWARVQEMRQNGDLSGEMVAILRDPVSRLVSCYANKFTAMRSIPQADLDRHELDPQPDFAGFVDRLDSYQELCQPIGHHSRPLAYFLGQSAEAYQRIFDLSQIGELRALINRRAGTQVVLSHFNPSRTDRGRDITLTVKTVDRIEKLYEEDLDLFGAYMKPNAYAAA